MPDDTLVNIRAISQEEDPTTRIERRSEEIRKRGGEGEETERKERRAAAEDQGNLDDAGQGDNNGGKLGYRTVGARSYAHHSWEIYVPEA